jgi:hypothetical protein
MSSIKKKLGKNPKTLEKRMLLDLTKEICSKVKKLSITEAQSLNSSRPTHEIMLIERTDGIFYFDNDSCANLKKAIKLIKHDPIYIDDISEKKIRDKYVDLVIHIISENMTSDQDIGSKVDSYLIELRTSIKEYRVMMPIEQLELSDLEEIKIGKVRLLPFSNLLTEKQEPSMSVGADEKRKIWGDVFIKAESTEAKSKGQREIERVINLLRAYIPILFHKEHNIKIGLLKYDKNSHYKYIIIEDLKIAEDAIHYLGPFGKYKLNKKQYEDLRANYCLDEISGMLSKEPSMRSDLENSIIMAIRWIGLGTNDEVTSDKFLKYAIALECLLITRGEKGDKTDPISKRAAFILGESMSDCSSIISEVKLLYDIRSAIVHQGCEAEEEKYIEDSVQKMYYYSMSTLLKLSEKTIGMNKWDDMRDLAIQMDEKMFER